MDRQTKKKTFQLGNLVVPILIAILSSIFSADGAGGNFSWKLLVKSTSLLFS